tara:strand:- start:367 stop:624 length:258 start_codon:yes stop_codon:yes gene_type:complete
MSNFHKSMPVALMAGLIASTALPASTLEMTEIGQLKLGEGEGYAEMIRYHAPSESLLVTSSGIAFWGPGSVSVRPGCVQPVIIEH